MRLQRLLTDDDAVSPVIGVILMVAITVILAAVIASFVLGLGDSQNVAPQASMTADYDQTSPNPSSYDGNLSVTHDSGDAVITEEVYLRGSGFWSPSDNSSWEGYNQTDPANVTVSVSGQSEGQPAIVAGDQLEFPADDDYELRVVWESTEGDTSDTLLEDDGPQA